MQGISALGLLAGLFAVLVDPLVEVAVILVFLDDFVHEGEELGIALGDAGLGGLSLFTNCRSVSSA